VGANLVEGDARFSDKESLQFFRIARASAREARYSLYRAASRKYVSADSVNLHILGLESVLRRMNALITTRRQRMDSVRESRVEYTATVPDDPWFDPFDWETSPNDPTTQRPNTYS
jgi:hypothetical protein